MNYAQWCSLSNDDIATSDVAVINLTVAAGLPGAEAVHVPSLIQQIDHWTTRVAASTERWSRNFVPQDDCRSESQFRMMSLLTVVQRDFKVRYNPACIRGPSNAMDSRNNFIHGPLIGHGGTCCSLPILYLAIGRRLGYPLFVVDAREHSFLRWDDGHCERFNIECTSVGFKAPDDEHYKRWPRPLSSEDLGTDYFLKNFTPRQELAQFIGNRGDCLLDNLKVHAAMEAYSHAASLDKRYHGRWAVATMMQRIRANLSPDPWGKIPLFAQIEVASPTPVEPWERWALPLAEQELLRIARLHEKHAPVVNLQQETFIVTA